MDIFEAITGRPSIREYTGEAVDRQTILNLISAAILAQNAVNEQPWMFTVVRDQAALDQISAHAKT